MHVGNALLALGAEAGDKEHLTVVVLAMKKDGLVLPGSRQEGGRRARLPGAQPSRRTSAVSLWPSRKRLGPDAHARQCGRYSSFLNWSGTLPALPLKTSSLIAVLMLGVPRRGPCELVCRRWRGRSIKWSRLQRPLMATKHVSGPPSCCRAI